MSHLHEGTISPSATGSVRQSPFRRQSSFSPAPGAQRASTPTSSPTKSSHLSPEKASPFVRRPSNNSAVGGASATERPLSPFARQASSISRPLSYSGIGPVSNARPAGVQGISEDSTSSATLASPFRRITPPEGEKENRAELASPAPESPSPFDGIGSSDYGNSVGPPIAAPTPSQANLRPTAHRIPTSSTVSTIRQPSFTPASRPPSSTATATARPPASRPIARPTNGTHSALPPSLLHDLRESFEVLDPNATGSLSPSTLSAILDQLGLPPQPVGDFGTSNLSLATYLDALASPLTQLSAPDELMAAFGAFDTDDIGQIDVGELTAALMATAPEVGEEDYRLSEGEVESVFGEFTGRRAFGARGLGAGKAGGKGDVFKYREFMGRLAGGDGGGQGVVA